VCQILSDGKFAINGFRNRDLRCALNRFASQKLTSQTITRRLRLFRAHRVIRKVPKTHRYVLTPTGRLILTALQAAHRADVDQLTAMAA
jgi:DNA-binding HxlR family transcriptional regulator